MNCSLLILLLLFCGCNKEGCSDNTLLTPPPRPKCPCKEPFECDKKPRYEEQINNADSRIFGPFNNQNTCGCD